MTIEERREIWVACMCAVIFPVATLWFCSLVGCGSKEPTPVAPDYTPQLTSMAESLKVLASREHSLVVPPNHAVVPQKGKPCK